MSKKVLIDVDDIAKAMRELCDSNGIKCNIYCEQVSDTIGIIEKDTVKPSGEWENDIDSYTDSDGVLHSFITLNGFDHDIPPALQWYINQIIAQAVEKAKADERTRIINNLTLGIPE